MASKGFTVHLRRLHSRQDQAQSISNDCQSNHENHEFNKSLKNFKIRPQSITDYHKLWRGFCRLSKNHWGQVIRKQSLNFRRKANHSHWRSTRTRGLKLASQHHYSDQDAEFESHASASLQCQDASVENRVSASLQWPKTQSIKLRLSHLCNTKT